MPRKYGIEIEFRYEGGRDNNRVIPEMQARGLRIINSRHTHQGHSATEWTLKRDGSVPGGGELVSPHLDWDNDADHAQVISAFAALAAAGANTNKSAGIHVHVEAVDFTPKQVMAVCRFVYKFEDAIYRIASSGWRNHRGLNYCEPISNGSVAQIMRIRTSAQLRSYQAAADRYQAINVKSLVAYGTLEFRVFNSTMNPMRALAYVALCIAIVDDARKGFSRSTAKHYPLGYMANAANPETASKAVFLRLQQILRYESGMSTKDWKRILWVWNDSQNQSRDAISRSRYA